MTHAKLRNLTLIPPSPLSPSWPFTISHSIKGRTGKITLTLEAPALWTRNVLAALQLLTHLVTDLKTEADRAERDYLISAESVQWAARLDTIRDEYSALRTSGLLHRAAIRVLVSSPRFADLGWRFAEFNRVVPSSASWNSNLHNRSSEALRVV